MKITLSEHDIMLAYQSPTIGHADFAKLSQNNIANLEREIGQFGIEIAKSIMPFFANQKLTLKHLPGGRDALENIIKSGEILSLEELRRQKIKHGKSMSAESPGENFLNIKYDEDKNRGFVYCHLNLGEHKPTYALHWPVDELPQASWINFFDSGIITRGDADFYTNYAASSSINGFNERDTFTQDDFNYAAALKTVVYAGDCLQVEAKHEKKGDTEFSLKKFCKMVSRADGTGRRDIFAYDYYVRSIELPEAEAKKIHDIIPFCQQMVISDLATVGQIAVPTRVPIIGAYRMKDDKTISHFIAQGSKPEILFNSETSQKFAHEFVEVDVHKLAGKTGRAR